MSFRQSAAGSERSRIPGTWRLENQAWTSVGQPLLRRALSLQMHEPLRQRIAVQYDLEGLSRGELDAYLAHQLKAPAHRSRCSTTPPGRPSIRPPKAFFAKSINWL
jgi:hypothetical protein